MNILEQEYTTNIRKELVKLETMASNLSEYIGQMRWNLDQVVYTGTSGDCSHCTTNHKFAAEKLMSRSIGIYNQIKRVMEGTEDDQSSSPYKQDIA